MMASGVRCFVGLGLILLSSCADSSESDTPPMLPAALKMFPECQQELHAFIDLTRLASKYGDDWTMFQDEIEDMKGQVLDCAEGSLPPIKAVRGKHQPARKLPVPVQPGMTSAGALPPLD
jgi:hypothetical protein